MRDCTFPEPLPLHLSFASQLKPLPLNMIKLKSRERIVLKLNLQLDHPLLSSLQNPLLLFQSVVLISPLPFSMCIIQTILPPFSSTFSSPIKSFYLVRIRMTPSFSTLETGLHAPPPPFHLVKYLPVKCLFLILGLSF